MAAFTKMMSGLRCLANPIITKSTHLTGRGMASASMTPRAEVPSMPAGIRLPTLLSLASVRQCSSAAAVSFESRVMAVCKSFDKISADKLTMDSHFINDLGLDSLDHVELIMAIEDEFGFEIPDDQAEKLLTPAQIARFVSERSE